MGKKSCEADTFIKLKYRGEVEGPPFRMGRKS